MGESMPWTVPHQSQGVSKEKRKKKPGDLSKTKIAPVGFGWLSGVAWAWAWLTVMQLIFEFSPSRYVLHLRGAFRDQQDGNRLGGSSTKTFFLPEGIAPLAASGIALQTVESKTQPGPISFNSSCTAQTVVQFQTWAGREISSTVENMARHEGRETRDTGR